MGKLHASHAAIALAVKLQEAMDSGDFLSCKDIIACLSDCLRDCSREMGVWCFYIDHYGDGESGEVIYFCGDDIKSASYEISSVGGSAPKCMIDMENAEDVVPLTTYKKEVNEDEHFASMSEAFKAEKLYDDEMPVYERYVSKKERDSMPSSDFAGKGQSFPIRTASDVKSAVKSLGLAGSGNYDTATIKANIIRIAKRKGFPLPKAWSKNGANKESTEFQVEPFLEMLREAGKRHSADDMQLIQSVHDTSNALGASCPDTFRMNGQESAATETTEETELALSESAAATEEIVIREAKADYEIKLIAPGKGATAYYPPEVLKRDGPAAFPAETKVYLNHPTQAQESEGSGNRDVTRFAGVLSTAAEWKESHAQGPGLYSRMKVFADHAPALEEKAKHLAMSILARGRQLVEAGKKVYREGLPVLAELTRGESVDIVPEAGAGGMILAEAAAPAAAVIEHEEVSGMDADELKALKENNARLMERAVYQDAVILSRKLLQDLSLHEAAKDMVCENVIGTEGAWKFLPRKDGALDTVKFSEMINTEAKRIGKMLAAASGSGRPIGMGIAAIDPPKPEEIAAREARRQSEEAEALRVFEALMGPGDAAKAAARGRVA